MSKKDFKGGLDSLLGNQDDKPKKGRPAKPKREVTKSSQEGTKFDETRATFLVKEDQLEELKAIAYWDRLKIKEVTNNAFEEYLRNYKKKNGEIKPIPKK